MGRMMRRVKCALNKFLSRFITDYLVLPVRAGCYTVHTAPNGDRDLEGFVVEGGGLSG